MNGAKDKSKRGYRILLGAFMLVLGGSPSRFSYNPKFVHRTGRFIG